MARKSARKSTRKPATKSAKGGASKNSATPEAVISHVLSKTANCTNNSTNTATSEGTSEAAASDNERKTSIPKNSSKDTSEDTPKDASENVSKAVTDAAEPKHSEATGSSGKQRDTTTIVSPRFPSPPRVPATNFDKEQWQGYCEIESDPAYFSVILREIGVKGITVREVPWLDRELMQDYPLSLGLVLLFRHRDFANVKQEQTCPTDLWFANQMPAQNSCATLAMIHTLLNIQHPDVDIGEHMRQFRQFTLPMLPKHRGQCFASWKHVKKIHNSFAKKMDMLVDDKLLARKASAARGRKPRSTSNGSSASEDTADSEKGAHHFIAFVPVKGTLWKLDGMDAQPTALGNYPEQTEDPEAWLDVACKHLAKLMEAGQDNEYGVYSIAVSPLARIRGDFLETENTIKYIDTRLTAINTEWKSFVEEDNLVPPSPSWLGSFDEEQRAAYPMIQEDKEAIDEEDMVSLLDRRAQLISSMKGWVQEFLVETQREAEEEERATARRHDYGPAIQTWLGMLARNGYLEKHMKKLKGKK